MAILMLPPGRMDRFPLSHFAAISLAHGFAGVEQDMGDDMPYRVGDAESTI